MNWLENFFISQSDKNKIEEIKIYIQRENYDRALLDLDILLDNKIVFVDLYLLHTFCSIKKGYFSQAISTLNKVFEIEKDNKEGLYYLGLVNKAMRHPERALDNFRKALNYGYNIPEIYNEIALIYIGQKEIEKAITQLKIGLSKYNNHLDTYKNLIPLLILQKNYSSALDLCRQALALKNDLKINQYLAQCYIQMSEYNKAINLYQSLLKLDNSFEIYNDLIKLYLKMSDYQTALEIVDDGLSIYPNDIKLKTRKLEVFYYLDKYDYLVTFSKTILSKNIEDPELLSFMGIGYFYNNLKDKAKRYFEQAKEIEQTFLNTFYLALYYLEKNDYQISLNFLLEAINYTENNQNKLKAYQELYKLYLLMQDYDKALEFSKKALEVANHSQKLEIQTFIKNLHKDKFDLEKTNDNEPKNHFIKNHYEIYNWLKKVKYYLKKDPKFEIWENKIDELIYELNTPLNIAVMGEFKAGKSTFINALLGKELAPMGVTPTTATLNFFKYGEQNKIRIIKEDKPVEELQSQMLAKYVDERVLDKSTIEDISYIEILFEWEKLKEINIIDTPGLNAGIKRHEEITQEFIKKADVVIWIFDVEQAGKSSEKKILDKIKLLSKNLIAVINGIDKVDDPDEVLEVIDYLKSSLGDYFEKIIGVSARTALNSKINDQPELYQKSGFIQLEKYLDENIYSKIAKIKIDSVLNNIDKIFSELAKVIEVARFEYQKEFQALSQLKQKVDNFEKELLSIEFITNNKLKNDFESIILSLAKDIKGFIKPSQGIIETVFKKNKFETAEKQFILDTIKTKVKIAFNSYSETLKKEIQEKSLLLINNLFNQSDNLINLSEKTEKSLSLKNIDNESTFFKMYNNQKHQSIYNEIAYPNYRYYQGFLDAGLLEHFFDEISFESNLNEEQINNILIKYLPNIFANLNTDFNNWKQEYIDFLNNFIDNHLKGFKEAFFDLDTEVFDQLLLLYSEIK